MILSLPEIMHQANVHYPGNEEYNTNYCSGIFNSFLGFGQVSGPLFGTNLNTVIGFRYTQDIVALMNYTFCVLYFVFGGGIAAFSTVSKESRKKWYLKQRLL